VSSWQHALEHINIDLDRCLKFNKTNSKYIYCDLRKQQNIDIQISTETLYSKTSPSCPMYLIKYHRKKLSKIASPIELDLMPIIKNFAYIIY
jgi:hypothetical protein